MSGKGRRPLALVTGGAGLIGSHLSDLLLSEGYGVRILDNLEPRTHRNGRPPWVSENAEFLHADIRDRDAVREALEGVDFVFHEAAYGGYMPEMAKYVHVNSFGTAQMLETIRDENLPVRKVVVASSQAVYREGAARCPVHGLVHPKMRPAGQLSRGDFSVRCPVCGEVAASVPTAEDAPVGGETVYAITKMDQERLVLSWGRQTGIPTVALRYSCTYGPRQSIFNPYTGIIAIFCTRLLSGNPPVIYEDGEQSRDLCYVGDIARANLLAATTDALDGLPVNIGSGTPTTVRTVATMLSDALGIDIELLVRSEFRPGEMRHLTPDLSCATAAGYAPQVGLEAGIERYLDWIKTQGDIRDYFAEAEALLRNRRIVHEAR
ncbi:NAD-dependent epimerase/dehydratase family protein [Rubrobacter indicoceani]|uniref:NAD-dependent epimerase/dehydratase family protein n=1 Tax=Rubrobacter indicoceani TaxID=2051957 RepID=UPI000E5B0DEE|nr:NAD-dependent epimerase/dehydratase family protein [Rubrobacter indicoceani]